MANDQKFPSEIVDLPSGGKIYGPNSPLKGGKIELKYMTAKEEDILTSQNLIKKGVKAAGGRARKSLGEIKKLVTSYRQASVSESK